MSQFALKSSNVLTDDVSSMIFIFGGTGDEQGIISITWTPPNCQPTVPRQIVSRLCPATRPRKTTGSEFKKKK